MNDDAVYLLRATRSVLVIDWPSRDVPVALARAGLEVIVRGGPGPGDYNAYEFTGAEVTVRRIGRAPWRVDLVYCHRPIAELPGIAEQARSLGARAVWWQSGRSAEGARDPAGYWVSPQESREARAVVEAAGLAYLDAPYIADVARQLADRP
jgi:hypothetical protein